MIKKSPVKIVEVGARDGLQNETLTMTPLVRAKLVEKLYNCGLKKIEAGAFVSPKWVPQMAHTDKVLKQLSKKIPDIVFPVLVPNQRGLDLAIQNNCKEIALFTAASETFCKKNINCSITESLTRFESLSKQALKKKIKVRAYISTAFGCPFEGKVKTSKVVSMTQKLLDFGCYEVSIGDTIGVATPGDVSHLLNKLLLKINPKKIAMHFHDTRGSALANVYESLRQGIRTFDSSLGGLGGCPYAPNALGNLATEDLCYMLDQMGFKTGVSLKELLKVRSWFVPKIQKPLLSHLGQSGIPHSGIYKIK